MEELGIGRPSTYANIMATIQDRGYVFKRGRRSSRRSPRSP
jgi:Topoisomerase IA